jgi:hypothetical protein
MFSDDEVLGSYLEDLVGFQRDYNPGDVIGRDGFHLVNGDIEGKLILWSQIKQLFECKNSDECD